MRGKIVDPTYVGHVKLVGGALTDATKLSPVGGTKAVAASGTGVPLVAASAKCTTLYIRAKATNAGAVCVGDSGVDKTTSRQVVLAASAAITINAPAGYYMDVAEFYVDADTNDDAVDFLYV
jgi:hypothetical protein